MQSKIVKNHMIFSVNNAEIGEVSFVLTLDKKTLICEHVLVFPQYRKQGYGIKIIEQLINYAKSNKLLIYPLCPFVKKYFAAHPQYNHLNAQLLKINRH